MSSDSPTTSLRRLVSTANVMTTARLVQYISSQVVGRLRGVAKVLFWLILLVNIRSLPFAWHVRVFWPTVTLRLHYYRCLLPYVFKPRSVYARAKEAWFDSISPIGQNPFIAVDVYKDWASVDDGDFNSHLSNSSYAKALDSARLKAVLAWFPTFFRAGGWMPLAGTHYVFVREIPMFTNYEMRLSILGWDTKWFFVIARFVSTSKTKHKGASRTPEERPGTPDFKFNPRIVVNGTYTPVQQQQQQPVINNRAAKAIAAGITRAANGAHGGGGDDDEDTTLHCVHISQLCFKIGRVTVPPALVLATNGFASPARSATHSTTDAAAATIPPPYSHTNPPPHWARVTELRCAPRGSMKAFVAFLKGGWRDVPAGGQWWEAALEGIEGQRRANMDVLNGVRSGMERVGKPSSLLGRPGAGNGAVVASES